VHPPPLFESDPPVAFPLLPPPGDPDAPPSLPADPGAMQAPDPLSHSGCVESVQSAFDAQPLHVPFAHTGAAAVHCAFVLHCTQCPAFGSPLAVTHTGVFPPQSPSAAQARHVLVDVSQVGAASLQSEFDWHATQVCFFVSQTGVGAAQSELFLQPPWGSISGFVSSHLWCAFDHS
jgi:hypothetical protein